ncbi:glycosyltransferase [Maridesulfovibrio sp.]|uniref:glycosyltransferase n=1 Tax=Maridesulfovibrio sp. TaxID=2795000 RepID=UPI0039EE7BB5
MNIAFVNSTHKWGGVKSWVVSFAEQLKLRGNNVYIWGRQPAFVEKCRDKAGHGEKTWFGPDFNPVAIVKFIYEFKIKKIDAVIINVGKDLTTAGVAAKILGIPLIQRIGLPEDIPYTKKVDFLHNWIKPHFLCPCEYIRDGFVDSLPYIKKEDTEVILNGKIYSEHELTVNRPLTFICTSQLNKGKGHEDVLNALARLRFDFRCIILGTGNIEKELHALCNSLGLSEKIEWVGFTKDVSGYLRRADVFVLPSYFEGLPNTLLEAMAEGLLPISRDVGGICEVWPDYFNEFLLPFESGPAEFEAAFEKVLDMADEQILTAKELARKNCKDHFFLPGKVEELEKWLLHDVIRNKNKS